MLQPRTLGVFCLTLGCGAAWLAAPAPRAFSQAGTNTHAASLDWDRAFAENSGARPVHFIADYTDARGPHRLEEWRTGVTHLRRRTDNRIDLHADMVHPSSSSGAADYLWQIVDLDRKIDNRISSGAMMRAGMFYSFYSMAHVIARPAGRFRLTALAGEPTVHAAGHTCSWFEVVPDGQTPMRICWSPELGIPLETRALGADGKISASFHLRSVDGNPVAPSVFAVNPAGLTVHDHDRMVEDD